jgi:hypothetical protein
MNRRRAFEDLKSNPKNVRFDDLCRVAEAFGFHFKGGKGSHRVYVQPGVATILNFQNVGGRQNPIRFASCLK